MTSLGEASIHVPRKHDRICEKESPHRVSGFGVCEWNQYK